MKRFVSLVLMITASLWTLLSFAEDLDPMAVQIQR